MSTSLPTDRLVIACSGLSSAERGQLERSISRLPSAVYTPDLTDQVTHLVAERVAPCSQKLACARRLGLPVVRPAWIHESLELKFNDTCMVASSVKISTTLDSNLFPGVHYCKLLSPARVVDWMMTDSFTTQFP